MNAMQIMLGYQVSNVTFPLYLQLGISVKVVQGLSYRCVFRHINGALFLEKKHCSLVHVGSSVIFVAGRSQILGTDNECSIVVAHSSKLLVELNAHRALQRCHVLMIHLIAL